MRSPVGRQVRSHVARTVFGKGLRNFAVIAESPFGAASVKVRDQQVQRLAFAVAPGRSVFQVEPLFSLHRRRGRFQFAAAADRILRMRLDIIEHPRIAADSQHAGQYQQSRHLRETGKYFLFISPDQLTDPERRNDHQEIIGDLRMVRTNHQRTEKRGKRGAGPHIAPISVPHAAEKHRRESQHHHFGHVPGTYNHKKVGRKTVCQRRNQADPRIDLHAKQHAEEKGHRQENQRRGLPEEIESLGESFHHRTVVLHIDQVGRHPGEHVALPLRIFAKSLAVLQDILRHAVVLQDIVLREHLALELRGKTEERDYQENDQRSQVGQRPDNIPFMLHAAEKSKIEVQSNKKLLR